DYRNCVAVGNEINGKLDWFGSGVLIAPNLVLTAGHCRRDHPVNENNEQVPDQWEDKPLDRVFIGHDISQPGAIYKVINVILHPKYQVDGHHDLALLVLEKGVGDDVCADIARLAPAEACNETLK